MRIKFDGALFSKDDMESLYTILKEKGIQIQPELLTENRQKGILEAEAVTGWVAVFANAFLPIFIGEVITYLKKVKKEKNPVIEIEERGQGKRQKLTISVKEVSEMDIHVEENTMIHVFITNKSEDE